MKQVVLGNVFPPEFFEGVKNTKLRDSLQRVMYETREDLDGIKKTLEDLGVEVIQVDDCWTDKLSLNPYKNFAEFLETNKNDALTKPLITPRDSYITMGDELLITDQYNPQMPIDGKHPLDMFKPNMALVNDMWKNKDKKLGPFSFKTDNELWKEQEYFDMNMNRNPTEFRDYVYKSYSFSAPDITRIGDTILVDVDDRLGFAEWYNKIKPDNKFKFKVITHNGHNDASMCLPRPDFSYWFALDEKDFFKETLPIGIV